MSRAEKARVANDDIRRDVGVGDEIELSVSGMTCASCAARVERTLSRHPGVEEARVNFAANRAYVTYRPQSVSVGELEEAVAKAGYHVAPASAEDVEAEGLHDRDQKLWWRLGLSAGLSG